jgi:hypothetical protein
MITPSANSGSMLSPNTRSANGSLAEQPLDSIKTPLKKLALLYHPYFMIFLLQTDIRAEI